MSRTTVREETVRGSLSGRAGRGLYKQTLYLATGEVVEQYCRESYDPERGWSVTFFTANGPDVTEADVARLFPEP